ncbi:MAG: hypothetical protein LW629_08625 [Burkholderiales bacterium]|jgi:hypothetical protein|nr:hypothetical protein [Burkholderiales bacterium]
MNVFKNMGSQPIPASQATADLAEQDLFLAEKTRLVKRFLTALTLLALFAMSVFLSVTNPTSQPVVHWHVLLSLGIVVLSCCVSYFLLAKGRPAEVAWLILGMLSALLINRVLVTDMGVRMPSLHLWILSIVLSYFVLGVSVGRLITTLACTLSLTLYFAEAASLIPGTVGERFPDVFSSLFVLLMVFICGYLGAEGLHAHNNLVFGVAEQKNKKLKKALADIEIVEGTQLRLLNMIATHTSEPSALLIAIADTLKTEAGAAVVTTEKIPVASIKFITNSLLKDFDAAIADIELDTQRVMSRK